MTSNAEELLQKALELEEHDRAALAGALIESLHGEVESGVVDAWSAEIRRRVTELESHSFDPVPWSQVRERLFRGYE